MKKYLILFLFMALVLVADTYAKISNPKKNSPTSLGIVIYSNDIETVWNAMRLANYSKKQGDMVQVFLLAKGVEVDSLVNENKDLKEQVDAFLEKGGEIQGCGTCLQSRKNDEPQVCKYSSMADLYQLIHKNKIVLTF